MIRLIAISTILLSCQLIGFAQDSSEVAIDAFARGNAAFVQEDFATAISAYEEALSAGSSANLHYNLGTAYAHEGKDGLASLHLLKALALDPNHADAQANLALLRKRMELPWAERGTWESAATILPLNTWAWVATGAFWLVVFLWLLRPREGSFPNSLARFLLSGVVVVSIAAMAFYHFSSHRGVVLEAVSLRIAPTESSPLGVEVEPGLQGEVRKQINGFYLVQTEKGDEGYLSPTEFGPIWEQ